MIESGNSSATISLTLLGDNLVEGDEDFALLLTSTSLGNFALGGDSALITILNDDASVSMGELSSSESVLSAALSSTTSLTCDFTDADFTQVSDYRVSLAVRAPDNSTTYTLCDGVASSGACAAGGIRFIRAELWSVPLYLPVGSSNRSSRWEL